MVSAELPKYFALATLLKTAYTLFKCQVDIFLFLFMRQCVVCECVCTWVCTCAHRRAASIFTECFYRTIFNGIFQILIEKKKKKKRS